MAIPIEVKSGKDFERHNALSNVLSNPDYAISKAYVLCNGNFRESRQDHLCTDYMTMFIERKQPMQRQIFRIDMTALK